MHIDLVSLVVWGTATRIFVPDLRRAGQRLLAAAVRAGAHHLHQQNASSITVVSPASGALAHQSEA